MRVQVLLSDVDIVTLRNPFPHVMRDCDVEAMSDGWDNATAYGAPARHMRAACFACCAMLDAPCAVLASVCSQFQSIRCAAAHMRAACTVSAASCLARCAPPSQVFALNLGFRYCRVSRIP